MRWPVARRVSPDEVAALGIIVVIVAFFSPVWAGGARTFLSDGQYNAFFAPMSLWSDVWIGGWPAGADTAAYVWYPLRIALLSTHLGFNAFVIAAYLVAALGTYAYLRLVSVPPLFGAVGALGFVSCGFMMAHLSHTSMVHATAWIPWMFAGVEGCISRQRRIWAVLATLAVAMSLLAGHTQLTFYGAVAVGAYLAWRLPYCWNEQRMAWWLLSIAGLAVGALAAAPQLLMTAEYIGSTPRAALDYASFVNISLPLPQLPTLLFPYLFGPGFGFGSIYFGMTNFPETCGYVSFLAFALAVPALAYRRGVASFWALLAAASLVLAVGGAVPAVAELTFRLPGFNLFRAPSRHLMEFGLAMSVLSALGAAALVNIESHRARFGFLAFAASLALVAIGLSIPSLIIAARYAAHAGVVTPSWTSHPAIGLGILGILAGAFATAALAVRRRVSMHAFVVCALIGMVSFAWYAQWRWPPLPAWAIEPDNFERDIVRDLDSRGGRMLYTGWLWNSGISAERARGFGMSSVNWYGPLIPRHAKELLHLDESGAVDVRSLANENAALDLYGVRYIAVRDGPFLQAAQATLASSRWRKVGKERNVTYYENLRAQPLGWVCSVWRESSPGQALDRLQDTRASGLDPREEALVEGIASGGDGSSRDGSADVRWEGPSSIRADVDSPDGGFLVIGVNNIEGWSATVDGIEARIYNADYALIGLPIARGRHEVTLKYRVSNWKLIGPWSAALAGLFLMAWLPARVRGSESKRVP